MTLLYRKSPHCQIFGTTPVPGRGPLLGRFFIASWDSSSIAVRSSYILAGSGTSCGTRRSRPPQTGSMGDMSSQIRSSLRLVTSTVRTNPACLSPSTLSPNLQSLGPDCDSGAQFALQDPEMASVKLEDCSQTLELNANIKDEAEEKPVSLKQLELSLRPVTSTVRTNPACLSPSARSPNLHSLGPDCDSGAQFALQDPEMASVKLEDCSQTMELNVNIKDEEDKIGKSLSHGDRVETFSTSREQQQEAHRAKRSHHCPHY
ncbi:uncharacterized protein LOC110510711 isoform X3 [Oncorhynchus mykiss]|uniref:uncharacterized protein LOC110510711 isoform X3 n=2 Tax=Oncorhynchus mykiss TaxID=8022 RepID=UPI001878EEAD|nr:uncharacterized protein LOC110510711 isoform X3 [Oncorhynchus mykiss]